MRKSIILAAVIAASGFGNAASAADWTGFYIGGNIGGAWSKATSEWTDFGNGFVVSDILPNATNQPMKRSSVIGGGQLGYNYQTGAMVVGLEADISVLGLNSSRTELVPAGIGFTAGSYFSESAKSHYLATVRGRLGYAVSSWLFYATGGLAVAKVSYTDYLDYTGGASQTAESSQTRTGWALGSGAEYALNQNWSLKAEYLYVSFGESTAISTSRPTFTNYDVTHHHRLTEQIARVGFNYKFD